MTTSAIARRAAALGLVVLALVAGKRALDPGTGPDEASSSADAPSTSAQVVGTLYGRVTTYDGTAYEGPLRWGGGEEAFWDHTFNGVKDENAWASLLPAERQAGTRRDGLRRPFMVHFGDIERIEARGDGLRGVIENGVAFDPDVRVTLKSGTVFDLSRLSSSDFDDGVRVWDPQRGVVDLGPRDIHVIELFAPADPREVPDRLHGTVRTRHGDFTGFIQWDREQSFGRDRLVGRAPNGERRIPFDTIRSIARHPEGGAQVSTLDGDDVLLSGTRAVGHDSRGMYVDDVRYGRVLVSWDTFERVDFSPGGSGPSYDDFLPGRPLAGTVTTRDGRRLTGRLVFDLDESETTETLDAPSDGVDYIIPFGRIASVVLPDSERADGRTTVTLRNGEEVQFDRAGDLGEENAGMLVFTDGRERPVYVPWADIERVRFDHS